MGLNRQIIFNTIGAEREYQIGKWGTETDKQLSISDWLLVLENELRKAKEHRMDEMVGEDGYHQFVESGANPKKRLIKIAAVCVAALENLE